MSFFQRLSIKNKFVVIVTSISMMALLLALSIIAYHDIRLFKKDLINNVESSAAILAINVAPAVLLEDEAAAQQGMQILTHNPQIIFSAAYDLNHNALAKIDTYSEMALKEAPSEIHFGTLIYDDYIESTQRILFDSDEIGYVIVRLDISVLNNRILQYAIAFVFVFCASLVLILILSSILQSTISKPINQLISFTHDVIKGGDYGQQIKHHRLDELGTLLDEFNAMMVVIAENEIELSTAKKLAIVEKENAEEERSIADKANQAKSEFLSSISHELRTPLNAIIGFSNLLVADKQSPLLPDHLESAQFILESGQHLLHLIDDVLDLSQIESGHINVDLQTVDVKALIGQVCSLMRSEADSCNITLKNTTQHEDALFVQADSNKLKQVLLNFSSNSVKYNNENGSVTFSCIKTKEDKVRICISDTGDGIPKASLPHLFEPFNRLDKANSSIQGTGIGLTICKKLVDLMHGEIGVFYNEDVGMTFWVEFNEIDTMVNN